MTESEKDKKLAEIKRDLDARKAKRQACGFCYFFKVKENATYGRCLKSLNGIKNNSTVDFCGGPRVVNLSEVQPCFK